MHPKPHPWPVPEGEPHFSIHVPQWIAARARIRCLPDPDERERYGLFFNFLEAGWSIIRPLQLAVEVDVFGENGRDSDVVSFVDVEITDAFRSLAESCIAMVPTDDGFRSDGPTGDLLSEAEEIARNVRLLAALEFSPDFPPQFRGIVRPAAKAFNQWAERMESASASVIDIVETAVRRQEAWESRDPASDIGPEVMGSLFRRIEEEREKQEAAE